MPEYDLDFERWRRDPISFFESGIIKDPETGQPFQLYEAEKTFLRAALTAGADGRLPYPELVFSAPKKSGKTAIAAMATLYIMLVHGGRFAEAYLCANDLEQSSGRVFQAITRMLGGGNALVKITERSILFKKSGGVINALANDYAGAAGANPSVSNFDELWGYTSERSRRLWDEMIPVPTRRISVRLTTTYAGFEGESVLLEELYHRGLKGEQIAPDLYATPGEILMYWSHTCRAPWQTLAWIEQMRKQLRPNQFLRMIENRWVTSESNFVDLADFDKCTDPEARPVLNDPHLRVFVGLDGSYSHDSTAIAVVAFDPRQQKVRMVAHKIFTPTSGQPIDFAAVEAELLALRRRFAVQAIFFDPFQLVALSQRMVTLGLPMEPFTQSSSNLEAAATNLAELIRHHNLIAYEDSEIRLALSRTVAVETARGIRISKATASHRIDIIAALSFAAFAAVRGGQQAGMSDEDRVFQARATGAIHASWEARQQRRTMDGPRSPAGVPDGAARLFGDGASVALAEDRAQVAMKKRWSRWGGW